jgi:hypothetical protein
MLKSIHDSSALKSQEPALLLYGNISGIASDYLRTEKRPTETVNGLQARAHVCSNPIKDDES